MADDTSPRTPSFSAKSSSAFSSARPLDAVSPSSFSTPVLCPRSPFTPLDSAPTTFGKRHREVSPPLQDKRYKAESSPRLCIELYKLESRVLFPCYIEKDLVKTGWLPFRERAEGECEAEESDEETVEQSQGLLSSQLDKSLQEEIAKECTPNLP